MKDCTVNEVFFHLRVSVESLQFSATFAI